MKYFQINVKFQGFTTPEPEHDLEPKDGMRKRMLRYQTAG